MHILGIETSCDETSVAVSKKRKILSNITVSQIIHSEYGGVVPEIASREHLSLINKVAEKAFIDAKLSIKDIDAIAVTNGPGLKGALMVKYLLLIFSMRIFSFCFIIKENSKFK